MQKTEDYDGAWKEALEVYFRPFMAFCFPQAYAEIDWSRGYEFLDRELQSAVRGAKIGRRHVDKLVRVLLRNGDEAWVLVHVEVQAQADDAFPRRMYIYNYRLFDKYGRPVASFAVLADTRKNWKPDSFSYELFGCRASLKFNVVKLEDWRGRWRELEESDNPFAVIVMAHLKSQETRFDPDRRYSLKWALIKRLYRRGYKKPQVQQLFRFIDWLMALPDTMEQRMWEELTVLEEERAMPYVTSVERIGIAKGIQQGIQQGVKQGVKQGVRQGVKQGALMTAREALIEVLKARFASIPEELRKSVEQTEDVAVLKEMLKRAATAGSVEEVQQYVRKGLARRQRARRM